MNDNRQDNDVARSFAPVIGFALGAIAGGVLALLLAPASGEKTRQRIGSAARRLSRDARQSLGDARDTVSQAATGLGADVKSAIDAGREAFRHDGKPLEAHPASRIAQTLDPPTPRSAS
jgi:gas vesicle protein